jgi:tRNA dimethylallyltransferase
MNRPLIAIVGETASGKSNLAVKLAEYFNGEIVCADSATIYKGFNIGTAKPSFAEQKRIKHHLLDLIDPADSFNVSHFQKLANQAINDIERRNKLPFLVGGSGLYVNSVIYNYSFLSPAEDNYRAVLDQMDLEELLAKIRNLGIDDSLLDRCNKRRLIRAIETNGAHPQHHQKRQNVFLIGIQIPRDILEKRIRQRVKLMIDQGLELEVRSLSSKYGWSIQPMQMVGYREWHNYFTGEITLSETYNSIVQDTINLAKKQRTWFKRNELIHWMSNREDINNCVEVITTFLNK